MCRELGEVRNGCEMTTILRVVLQSTTTKQTPFNHTVQHVQNDTEIPTFKCYNGLIYDSSLESIKSIVLV